MSSEIFAKLKADGRVSRIDTDNHELSAGDEILIESKNGLEIAFVISSSVAKEKTKQEKSDDAEEKFVFIRKLSDKDRKQIEMQNVEAKKYFGECKIKIEKYKLPMQLLDASLSFDDKKLTFYFTAPSRVDFRILVSDLAHSFGKVIRLQQVGARDEARYLGGVGRCGETICCRRFLKGNLESVTLDMAVDQNLAQMGSNRVTGVCGKLMCCLKYELDIYHNAKKKFPLIGSEVKVKEGKGTVVGHNVLKNNYSVKLEKNGNLVEVNC